MLFCYLAPHELLNATVRAVASAAGVSRQPVSDTKRRILDDEYIIQTRSTVRWVPLWRALWCTATLIFRSLKAFFSFFQYIHEL